MYYLNDPVNCFQLLGDDEQVRFPAKKRQYSYNSEKNVCVSKKAKPIWYTFQTKKRYTNSRKMGINLWYL
jgi:hypothetical protein